MPNLKLGSVILCDPLMLQSVITTVADTTGNQCMSIWLMLLFDKDCTVDAVVLLDEQFPLQATDAGSLCDKPCMSRAQRFLHRHSIHLHAYQGRQYTTISNTLWCHNDMSQYQLVKDNQTLLRQTC